MSDTEDNKNKQTTRRDFMVLTASSVAAVGAACTLWPLVDSLNPSADVLALSSIEVDLSNLQLNENLRVENIIADNMEVMNSPRIPIATIAMTRALKQEEAAAPKAAKGKK
jgi:ubiquinol-cytochrome c reductase iron-sulfur subunit